MDSIEQFIPNSKKNSQRQRKRQRYSAFIAALGITGFTITPLDLFTPSASARTTFFDVNRHWAQGCIENLTQRNILSGYPDNSFKPDAPVSRAEFAAMVFRAFPTEARIRQAARFADVSPREWSYNAIRAAQQAGFLTGSGKTFNPKAPITRVQALAALAVGLNFAPISMKAEDLNQTFEDARDIPDYARNAMVAATERGLVVNYPDIRKLEPNKVASRAEVAGFLCQALSVGSKQASAIAPQYVVNAPTITEPQIDVQTFGNVRAELAYTKENFAYKDVSLKIIRNGETLLNQIVPIEGGLTKSLGFALRDLDGDGEPEVLLDFFVRGQGCCSYSLIYRYISAQKEYSFIQQRWGYVTYQLRDLDLDGIPEFDSFNSQFAMQFVNNPGDAFFPRQIWQYRQGQLFDVTRLFRNVVESDARSLWAEYQKRQGQKQEVKGILAAYLANKYMLGEGAQGWSDVQQAYTGSDRSEYLINLRNFLRSLGYFR